MRILIHIPTIADGQVDVSYSNPGEPLGEARKLTIGGLCAPNVSPALAAVSSWRRPMHCCESFPYLQ